MSDLIDNEQTKLLANALDRASTACLTVGVLAPVAALIYAVPGTIIQFWLIALSAAVWFSTAVALHLTARTVLKRLAS